MAIFHSYVSLPEGIPSKSQKRDENFTQKLANKHRG